MNRVHVASAIKDAGNLDTLGNGLVEENIVANRKTPRCFLDLVPRQPHPGPGG